MKLVHRSHKHSLSHSLSLGSVSLHRSMTASFNLPLPTVLGVNADCCLSHISIKEEDPLQNVHMGPCAFVFFTPSRIDFSRCAAIFFRFSLSAEFVVKMKKMIADNLHEVAKAGVLAMRIQKDDFKKKQYMMNTELEAAKARVAEVEAELEAEGAALRALQRDYERLRNGDGGAVNQAVNADPGVEPSQAAVGTGTSGVNARRGVSFAPDTVFHADPCEEPSQAAVNARGMIHVEVLDGPHVGDEYSFFLGQDNEDNHFLIGRCVHQVNGVILNEDVAVSSVHGAIIRKDEDYYFQDRGSTHGTFDISDVRLKKYVPLEENVLYKVVDGAIFEMGDSVVKVTFSTCQIVAKTDSARGNRITRGTEKLAAMNTVIEAGPAERGTAHSKGVIPQGCIRVEVFTGLTEEMTAHAGRVFVVKPSPFNAKTKRCLITKVKKENSVTLIGERDCCRVHGTLTRSKDSDYSFWPEKGGVTVNVANGEDLQHCVQYQLKNGAMLQVGKNLLLFNFSL